MIKLRDVTFVIPLRIDSKDRLTNLRLCLGYLINNFETNIILLEDGPTQKVNPRDYIRENINFRYIFRKTKDKVFHRTAYINQMAVLVTTKVIVIYDVDVILPPESYVKARDMIINDGYDLIRPFSFVYKIHKKNPIEDHKFNYDSFKTQLAGDLMKWPAGYGFAVFVKLLTYRKLGADNEDFISYGPEDNERFYRFKTLGFKVCDEFNDCPVFHLEHFRGINSSSQNPHFLNNDDLFFSKLEKMNLKEATKYYKTKKLEFSRKYPYLGLTMNVMGQHGRLGNQIYQYLCLKSLSLKFNVPIYIPPCTLTQLFNISGDYPLPFPKIDHYFEERDFSFSPIDNLGKFSDIKGYFQSPKYFENLNFRNYLIFKSELVKQAETSHLFTYKEELVAIHHRLTDYYNNPAHIVNSKEFIIKCINLVKEKIINPKFIVFSDDIELSKKLLDLDLEYYKSDNDLVDFIIMSKFRHFILSASTYSLWAAQLAENDNKLIFAPKIWFQSNFAQQINFKAEDFFFPNMILI